jgi:hypothetical protein
VDPVAEEEKGKELQFLPVVVLGTLIHSANSPASRISERGRQALRSQIAHPKLHSW